MRGGVKNFLLGPTAGEKERDATKRHHTNCVSRKRHWHELPQATHFANVLFAVASVNDGAGTEKQERLEEAMREQMHDPSRNTTNTYIGPERRVGGEMEVMQQPSLLDKARSAI